MTVVQFDPPIDEAIRVMYEAVATGLTTVGAARGLPAMQWTPHHDFGPPSRRSRIYGRPDVADGDWAGVVAAQQWAQILDLVELDRDQTWDTLQETYAEGVRIWHRIVSGIRVIIQAATVEQHTVRPNAAGRARFDSQISDTRPLPTATYQPAPPTRPTPRNESANTIYSDIWLRATYARNKSAVPGLLNGTPRKMSQPSAVNRARPSQ